MKSEPAFFNKVDPVDLFTTDPEEPPSWKYHHGCVMFLSRPDRLKGVSEGLEAIATQREEQRRQKSPEGRSRKRWQRSARKALLASKVSAAFARPSTTPSMSSQDVSRMDKLLDEHERQRAMNKFKAKDDMYHPKDFAVDFSPSRFKGLEDGLAALKGQLNQLGDLYDIQDEEDKVEKAMQRKAHSYSIPTEKEWEKINGFWMELNVKYGSLAQAFRAFDLNGNGSLSCIEFTTSCEMLKVGGDEYSWHLKLFHLLDGDGSNEIGVDEFMGSRLVLPDSKEGQQEVKRRSVEAKKRVTVGEKLAKKRADRLIGRASSREAPSAFGSEYTEREGDPADPEFFWSFLRQFFPGNDPGVSYSRAFKKIDVNRNGDLSQTEFVQGMQMVKYPGTRSDWKKLFFELDDDQDGSVRIGEFSNWQAPGSITKHDIENEALLAGKRYQARLNEEMNKSRLKEVLMDSAKHTTIENTPAMSAFDHVEEKLRFVPKQERSAMGEWTRTYGQVMALNRKDNCQTVRNGLAQMASDRITQATRVRYGERRPLSPGRSKPPAMGALRKFPNKEIFAFRMPRSKLDLPITTELAHLEGESRDVWRRRDYN